MTGVLGALLGSGDGLGRVTIADGNVLGFSSASFSLLTNGTAVDVSSFTEWLQPQVGMEHFEAKMHQLSGSQTIGVMALDTWLPLTSSVTWGIYAIAPAVQFATGVLSIRNKLNNLTYTATLYLEADASGGEP